MQAFNNAVQAQIEQLQYIQRANGSWSWAGTAERARVLMAKAQALVAADTAAVVDNAN